VTPADLAEWGRSEWAARLADLDAMRAGTLTLDEVQARAKARRRAVGLSMAQASRSLPTARERRC
jgi:hypothetical protein